MACEIIGLNCSLNISIYIYALIGGILPSLLWLWFWMHEEHKHHEPRKIILLTFLLGMLSVLVAIPLEKKFVSLGQMYSDSHMGTFSQIFSELSIITLIVWALIEETVKYLSARFVALKKPTFVHPIDAFIYLTTASLGFSAMENSILLISPLFRGETIGVINALSARFMGASLLHFLTSGVLALFIGLTFYASRAKKALGILIGLITAVLLHSLFNFFIINNDKQDTFSVFLSVWVLIIFLTISLERVKKIKKF